MSFVTEYKKFNPKNCWEILRSYAGSICDFIKVLPRRANRTSGWIRFPLYHHVFDDERLGFSRQLEYMKNLGDFITLDDAVFLLNSGGKIDGRYFCITFDDGFKNCFTNALPILLEKNIVAAFFLPVRYVDSSIEKCMEWNQKDWGNTRPLIEFLNWDDCRKMAAAGAVFGSHTVSHPKLIELDYERAVQEMRDSKTKIEQELGNSCAHFACPYGYPGLHFITDLHPAIAKEVGYQSFLTTRRGSMHAGDSPYLIKRYSLLANLANHRLRIIFSF